MCGFMGFSSRSLCTVTLGSVEAENYGRKPCRENSIFPKKSESGEWVEEGAEGERERK